MSPIVSNLLFIVGVILIVGWLLYIGSRGKLPDPLDVDSLLGGDSDQASSSRHLRAYPSKARYKKHPQSIFALDASFFDCVHFLSELNRVPAADFLDWPETASALVLKERDALEPDARYRQLLPYTIVRRRDEDGVMRFLAYQRTNKVGEARLAGKASVGFGGHIDASSAIYRAAQNIKNGDSIIDLKETIEESARRERDEELRICAHSTWFGRKPHLQIAWGNAFITQNSDPERMHLGIVMYIELGEGMELECAESELVTLGMKSAAELLAAHHNGEIELEAWSRLVLEECLNDERPTSRHARSHYPALAD